MDWKSRNIHEFDPEVAKYRLISNLSMNFAKGISALKFLNEMEEIDPTLDFERT